MQVSKYDWSGERTRRDRQLKRMIYILAALAVVTVAAVVGWEVMALA